MSTANLIALRQSGMGIATLRHTISNNHMAHRYCRHRNLNYFVIERKAGKQLGQVLAGAIQRRDCSLAMQTISDSSVTFNNTYDFFEEKFNASVSHCDRCDTLAYEDDMSSVDDEGSYCEYCLDRHYYWSERDDRWASQSDEDRDGDERQTDGVIGSYHSSKNRLGLIPCASENHKTKIAPIYLGLELEIEINSHGGHDRFAKAQELLNAIGQHEDKGRSYPYCLCESDGSIHHGFEVVTGWTSLRVHEHQLTFFKNRFSGAKSHDTKTCGLHVHISKGDMSLLHAAKMVEFINDCANRALVMAVARRDASRWSAFKDKKGNTEWRKFAVNNFKSDKQKALCNLNQDRYEALNFQNPKTVEFRLFRGSLKYETIMACLEFAYATYFFCKSASRAKLTTEHFLSFICQPKQLGSTRYLREYLDQKAIMRSDGLTLGAFSLVSLDGQKEAQ